MGGLARSVMDSRGFTWDLGGHVAFSQFEDFDRLLDAVLAPGEMISHTRRAEIFFNGSWVPYPFQENINCLSPEVAFECAVGAVASAQAQSTQDPPNFAAWLLATYGEGLVRHFFGPYNEKLWTIPLEEMSHEWVAERIAPLDWKAVLHGLTFRSRRTEWGPNRSFTFPARGGLGRIWQAVAEQLEGQVRLGSEVAQIDPVARSACTSDGREIKYDALVSTMPLDLLVDRLTDCPEEVRIAAKALAYNCVQVTGLGYHAPVVDRRNWMYFPQPEIPFYRATNFATYSPANVPDGDIGQFSSWLTEVASPVSDGGRSSSLLAQTDSALRWVGLVPGGARVISAHEEMIERAYPIPTLDRDEALHIIQPWLEQHGIFSRGRLGTWRYEIGNMSHAVEMGIQAADRLIRGHQETLFTSGSGAAVMDRSRIAQSAGVS